MKVKIKGTNKVLVIDEPCLRCGIPVRLDYYGLCMDCADELGISELFKEKKNIKEIVKKDLKKVNWFIAKGKSFKTREEKVNFIVKKMIVNSLGG